MFYDEFVKICKDRGISPSAVLQTIGLNKSNITYWKKGSIPSSKNLQKIADYFKVTTDYLLTGADPKIISPPSDINDEEDIDINSINFALSGEVHELTDAEKRDVINFARFLKSQRKNAERKED